MDELIKTPDLLDEDKEFKDFFYQDIAYGALKRLSKERSTDDAYLEVIAKIMEQFMFIYNNEIKRADNDDLAESMKSGFDPTVPLHIFHYE